MQLKNIQKSNLHYTPEIVYEKLFFFFGFHKYFDPCPIGDKFDGLSISWKKWNFVNPPYDEILDFILKAFLESLDGKKSVFVLPVKTTSLWWKITEDLPKYYFEKRLRFFDEKCNEEEPSFQDHFLMVIE